MKVQELPADDNSCGGFPLTNRLVCPSHTRRPLARWALKHADFAGLTALFGKLIDCVCGTPRCYSGSLPYTDIFGTLQSGRFAEEHHERIDFSLSSIAPHRSLLKPHFSIGMHAKSK